MKKYFYEKNPILIDEKYKEANCTFGEVVAMTEPEFETWVKLMRRTLKEIWDEYDCPVRSGYVEEEIIESFNSLLSDSLTRKFPMKSDEAKEKNEEYDCIDNTITVGSCVDQFFPRMFKVPINRSTKQDGISIYDLFANDKFENTVVKFSKRHFKKDSFGFYSFPITTASPIVKVGKTTINVESAADFITKWNNLNELKSIYNFWILARPKEKTNSSYKQDGGEIYTLTKEELKQLIADGSILPEHITNIDLDSLNDETNYILRVYDRTTRMFPSGFKPFRMGYSTQAVVNFPPTTARYLYEKYLDAVPECRQQNGVCVLDTSMGWGGRMLGALSVSERYNLLYLGNDPAGAPGCHNYIPEIQQSRYEYLYNFHRQKTNRNNNNPFISPNEAKFWYMGSEDLSKDAEFQKYKGLVDFSFTSTQYFTKEKYSNDANQAAVKFGHSYEAFRDEFLRPTLETIVTWLRPGRYMGWNIASVRYGDIIIPLEEDSFKILDDLGMQFVRTEKMLLASMPGGNRVDENDNPTTKNAVKIDGRWEKYEPIFIFFKKNS